MMFRTQPVKSIDPFAGSRPHARSLQPLGVGTRFDLPRRQAEGKQHHVLLGGVDFPFIYSKKNIGNHELRPFAVIQNGWWRTIPDA